MQKAAASEMDAAAFDPISCLHLRAGDRTRTGDVQLGKLAFYQLNYARNAAHPQTALPTEASAPRRAG